MKKKRFSPIFIVFLSTLMGSLTLVQGTAAQESLSEIKIIATVDGNAITNYDLQKRIAFLNLQHRTGDLEKIARSELVDEMLKKLEMERHNISVSDQQVAETYNSFAERNHVDIGQFSAMLEQSGITVAHFKEYLRTQMGWNALVIARYHAEQQQGISEDKGQAALHSGQYTHPTTREYHLKQLIFVIPSKEHSAKLGRRKAQVNALRRRFHGCGNIRSQLEGILDVTIRDLGYVLEPQLPPQWAQKIKNTHVGGLTAPMESPNGVDAIAVCEVRRVSDDRVTQYAYKVHRSQAANQKLGEMLSKKYLKQLHSLARIRFFS